MKSFLIIGLILGLVACDGESGPTACTEEARSSVTLKIIDVDTNETLDEATIVWSVDGGAKTTTACTNDDAFVDDCESFPITYEVDGEFEITVSATGYADQTKNITVVSDECHVIGKSLTFKMNTI